MAESELSPISLTMLFSVLGLNSKVYACKSEIQRKYSWVDRKKPRQMGKDTRRGTET